MVTIVGDEGDLAQQLAALRERNAELTAELAGSQRREAVLSSILVNAPDFLAHLSLDGSFLFLNRLVPGLQPADLIGRTTYDFISPAEHQVVRQAIGRAIETKTAQDYETVGVGPDHRPTPYFTRIAPVLDDDGSVASLVMIATDVTRLKAIERARAEGEAKLQHVLTATGMGTWTFDISTGAAQFDAVALDLLGLPKDANTFDQIIGAIHPDDRARVAEVLDATAAAVDEYLRTGRGPTPGFEPIEHRVTRADGRVQWLSASARLCDGRMVGGMLDVTARKRLEAQSAQAQKLESIGRLAGGIAHDFNNLLTAMMGYGELATRRLPIDSPARNDLAEIRRACERSVALTSQLLAFARQQVIQPRVTNLNTLVAALESLMHRLLGEHITIRTSLAAQHVVLVDPNQFEQVLLNLATNARDAMPHGGELLIQTTDIIEECNSSSSVPELPPGSYVQLTVTDSGNGIAALDLVHIFEPFFTTKDLGKGTGLGLATVYGVIAQNRGHISVTSELGLGTTFKILLPTTEGVAEHNVKPPPMHDYQGRETVLVVEDEAMVREIAVRALTSAGYKVLVAKDGVDGLAIAAAHDGPIELLVTDVVMPRMGGKQLADELRLKRPELSVLFVSGYPDASIAHDGILAAGVALLAKPFTPTELKAAVRSSLELNAAKRLS